MRIQTINHPRQLLLLMRFHKPIGIFLLLWPTLWALWIAAKGMPHFLILSVFILGVVVMRAAGCVINDIADRHVDPHVTRTQQRPLAAGQLTVRSAVILLCLLLSVAFGLVSLLNGLTIQLAVAAAALTFIYPFCKRFTHWPQLILGLAWSWGIPMAFAAVTQHIPAIAWWLFATSVLWTITFDTEYAMTDRHDDKNIGIKSTAVLFGQYDRLMIALLQLTVMALLIGMGYALQLHWPYYASLVIAGFIFLYQQKLIQRREPQACLRAFLNNNWFGMIIFLGVFLSYW